MIHGLLPDSISLSVILITSYLGSRRGGGGGAGGEGVEGGWIDGSHLFLSFDFCLISYPVLH